jgi:hypothetical protein
MFRFVHLFGFSANVPSLSSNNRPIRCPRARPSGRRWNWLCFAQSAIEELDSSCAFARRPLPLRPCPTRHCRELALFRTIDLPSRVPGPRPLHPAGKSGLFRMIGPGGRNWLCFVRWAHGRLLLHTSNFTLQASPVRTSPPNTRRIAGIVSKDWAAPPSKIAVSYYPDANKENFRAGPF